VTIRPQDRRLTSPHNRHPEPPGCHGWSPTRTSVAQTRDSMSQTRSVLVSVSGLCDLPTDSLLPVCFHTTPIVRPASRVKLSLRIDAALQLQALAYNPTFHKPHPSTSEFTSQTPIPHDHGPVVFLHHYRHDCQHWTVNVFDLPWVMYLGANECFTSIASHWNGQVQSF
jgi:hypothetical protein